MGETIAVMTGARHKKVCMYHILLGLPVLYYYIKGRFGYRRLGEVFSMVVTYVGYIYCTSDLQSKKSSKGEKRQKNL